MDCIKIFNSKFNTDIYIGYFKFILPQPKLLKILSPYFNSEIQIQKDIFGKPHILCEGIFYPISLSHSKNIFCVLFSNKVGSSLGIDVQLVKTFSRPDFMLKKVLSQKESYILNKLNDSKKSIFMTQIFSTKEAILKDVGFGLFYDPRQICLELHYAGNFFQGEINILERKRYISQVFDNNFIISTSITYI